MTPTNAPDLPELDPLNVLVVALPSLVGQMAAWDDRKKREDICYEVIRHLQCLVPVILKSTRPQSEASAEALEVFDAMIKYGEHQMECSFEELLNNMKVKEAKQTIRAALATPVPVGWRPIESAPKDGTRVLLWTAAYIGDKREFIIPAVGYWSESKQEWRGFYNQYFKPTHWQPLPAPPHTEGR